MTFTNTSDIIGKMVVLATNNITGSEALTLFSILVLCLAATFFLRIPLQFGILFITPLLIILMAYNTAFLIIGGIVIIFEVFLVVKALGGLFN